MDLIPHQIVHIRPQSGIHEGRLLKSRVIHRTPTAVLITLPYLQGKVALLPTGTMLSVEDAGGLSFHSEIISKTTFASHVCLELELPYNIIKQGRKSSPRIITVTSGKGGAGKTSFLINTAVAFSQMGKRVCIVDGDLGTANVDVLLNLNAYFTIEDVLEDKKRIFDILLEGPAGTIVVPGASGFQPLTSISQGEVQKLINHLGQLEPYVDIILIDTCPGVSNNVMFFNQLADEIIMLTTPEPHSITDAYATLKVLVDKKTTPTMGLVINRAEDRTEAENISLRITQAARRFLSMDILQLGYVLDDPHVPQSIKRLQPCVLKYPEAPASICYRKIASQLLRTRHERSQGSPTGKLKKILRLS